MESSSITAYHPIYFNPKEKHALYEFCRSLKALIQEPAKNSRAIVLLCIGSDRATGDCLGPLIGYKLSKIPAINYPNLHIYGTLSSPVHAKNLAEIITDIQKTYEDPFLIALDASLGLASHVGFVTLSEGSLNPGIGVNKQLPSVGDIHITGIVNLSGMQSHLLLQTTRLDEVMHLADFICMGMRYAFSLC
ncbi:MAG: hypothetical protein PWP24_1786 [Clostridiales bacterium]|nr:hypothetical protein [Clostridiales bacterium]